jgi:catechol 2,3-dioxygenase
VQTESKLIAGVATIDLRVRDIDETAAFYQDVVGLHVTDRAGDRCVLRPPGGAPLVRLNSEGVVGPADARATGLFHTAFLFPDRASLAAALARMVAAGVEVGAGDHGVSEALYTSDPDGNGIELYRDRPRDEWPRPGPGERVGMYTRPVDLDGLLADAGDLQSSAPAGTIIGHVHFQASDIDETVDFYTRGLGLDLMARLGDSAAFFASGGYHHHVGANTWRSRGGPPSTRDRAGLDQVTFRVDDATELAHARERLNGINREPGGTGPDLEITDPDGIDLRFSTDV